MPIHLPHRFHPRSYQQAVFEAFDRGITRAACPWHRRSGKDTTALNLTITKMVERVGAYYHFFPTFAQGKRILWDGINRAGMPFLEHFPPELVAQKNETELQITLTNGSIWQLIGTDNMDRVVGTNPVGCTYSEFSLQNPKAWDLFRPILRENGGWALFLYTMRGRNHAYKLFEMAKRNPGWFCSFLTVADTRRDAPGEDGGPVITEADIEKDRAEGMAEELIRSEYYNDADVALVGAYYGKHLDEVRQSGRIAHVPWEPGLPVDTWWDLGVSDSTVILFTQGSRFEVRVIDCLEASGEGLPFYAKVLRDKPYVYGTHHAPHDIQVRELGSGKSRLEMAQALGLHFEVVPNLPLADGINAARAFFARCWFDADTCEPLLNALASYRKAYDEAAQTFRNHPEHSWASHFADAFRYLAVGFREPEAPRGPEDAYAVSNWDPFAPLGGRDHDTHAISSS